ncbi:phytanoyl-CoA dioxygenase family protein [Candidatus Thioglobus sp.]|nr:phytanoyl-CoA dioxygenase family protein [Candidatus Thioglobus sp.]
MINFFSNKNKIFSCDVSNLPDNFKELAIESYNNYGIFYITGLYSQSEIAILRNELNLTFEVSPPPRTIAIQNITDKDRKNKFYNIVMNPLMLDVLNSTFSNSDVSLSPPYEVVKNYLPHSTDTIGTGWHRDCGGQLDIDECRKQLSSKEFIFGKIGIYLQDNSEYGGAIDIIPGSNRDYFRLFKSYQFSKLCIFSLFLLQKKILPLYKIIVRTKVVNYLMGAITTNVKAGDAVVFDYRLWHQGTSASPSIEKGLIYNHKTLQANLPKEKTKYVFYCQFGNSLGIKSYFLDRLNRKGNSTEIDSWINEAANLESSEIDIHEFVKRDSLLDGTFKDLFGLPGK